MQSYIEEKQPTEKHIEEKQPMQSYLEEKQPMQSYLEEKQPMQSYIEEKQPMQSYIEEKQPMQSYIEEKQLVTIERISAIFKHPNADSLYIAKVQGYDIIINLKAMFGDVTPDSLIDHLIVYFQIDSLMPTIFENNSFWSYLDKTYMGKRVKSAKIRGIVSQGLILDFGSIQALYPHLNLHSLPEGYNLTNEIGVIKYYHPYDAEGPFYSGGYDRSKIHTKTSPANLSPFPEYIPKTDQPRLQSNIKLISNLPKDRLFAATVKFDGQSTTWYYYNGEVGICSRNYKINLEYEKDEELRDKANDKFRQINEKYNILNKLKDFGRNIAIQGELYGMAINNNRHHRNDVELAVFDIYDIDNRRYLSHSKVKEICFQFILPMVDIVFEDRPLLSTEIEPWIALANAQKYLDTKGKRTLRAEGVVVKTSDDATPYISFKVISPEFLIKYNL